MCQQTFGINKRMLQIAMQVNGDCGGALAAFTEL